MAEVDLQRLLFPCVPENLRGVREGEKDYGASDEALEAPAEAAAAAAAVDEAEDPDEGVEALDAPEVSWVALSPLLEPLEGVEVCLEAVEKGARRLPHRRWRKKLASLARLRLSHSDDRGPRP